MSYRLLFFVFASHVKPRDGDDIAPSCLGEVKSNQDYFFGGRET